MTEEGKDSTESATPETKNWRQRFTRHHTDTESAPEKKSIKDRARGVATVVGVVAVASVVAGAVASRVAKQDESDTPESHDDQPNAELT